MLSYNTQAPDVDPKDNSVLSGREVVGVVVTPAQTTPDKTPLSVAAFYLDKVSFVC